jgi:UDP:flavonoid glycosyltransferase YjiC (YdhE family)
MIFHTKMITPLKKRAAKTRIMQITILTYGSRGDVQPHLALGVRLQKLGYQINFAAPERFGDFVTEHGLEFSPLAGDPAKLSRAFVDQAGSNPLKNMKVMLEYALPLAEQVWEGAQRACQNADAVIHSFIMLFSGQMLAEQLGIPQIHTNLFPVFTPTREFSAPSMPALNFGSYNWLTHWVMQQSMWQGSRIGNYLAIKAAKQKLPMVNTWPLGRKVSPPVPLFYAISPTVLPKPADWPSHAHMTGYWFLESDNEWQAPKDLADFIHAGPPPIYIGFGSMITKESEKLLDTVVEAVQISGQRAVLLSGWTKLDTANLTDQLFVADNIPHDWLFPQMSVIVHHGGAGTTAAAFHSGKPQVVVPFAADQPFWARQAQRLGSAPAPLPRRKLNAKKLAAAITTVLADEDMQQRAGKIGERIRGEDGLGQAAKLIQAHFGKAI